MKFRIFCELLAKTMLESIDFTDVLEGYRRNEKPKRQGIATLISCNQQSHDIRRNEKPKRQGIATIDCDDGIDVLVIKDGVEMKSPRDRALQRFMCLY